jgi:uncharacterized membrane protein (DUF2068 family)
VRSPKISHRPLGLVLIVAYKGFTFLLLATTAIAILLALKNYEHLAAIAENYMLTGKQQLIRELLERALNLQPKTLKLAGAVALVYAAVTLVETWGLWYEKIWARWWVIGIVSLSLPAEVFELAQGVSWIKFGVFLINLGVLWYLLREFPRVSLDPKNSAPNDSLLP